MMLVTEEKCGCLLYSSTSLGAVIAGAQQVCDFSCGYERLHEGRPTTSLGPVLVALNESQNPTNVK
jgi:hypothetical protein